MDKYNRGAAAPGKECAAWKSFVHDCYTHYNVSPGDGSTSEIEPSQNFADYWLSVSRGENASWDPETGAWITIDPDGAD
jgi:hypothetical protein